MLRYASVMVATGLAGAVLGSQEGPLPLSSFRLESGGTGNSGNVTVEGKQNGQAEIVELRIRAFGKDCVVPPEKLRVLAGLGANGIRISYEAGYDELGGRTVYVHLQAGSTSHAVETALLAITEKGTIEVSRRTTTAPAPDAAIQVEATVMQYIPRAMRDLFDDGRCVAFDAAELRLTAPPEWQGSNLVVHCTPDRTNSPLSTVGGRCRFEIGREYLAGPAVNPATGAVTAESPFEGALVNLMELPSRVTDCTKGESGICEVHRVAMTRRAVPFAHRMIPMSREAAEKGEWKRRITSYPHLGDCEPATDIVLPGQDGLAVVFVCPECERAKRMTPDDGAGGSASRAKQGGGR